MLGALALPVCSSFLRNLFSLSAYDCDFFNKGKPILPKRSLRGQGTASPVLKPQQHQPPGGPAGPGRAVTWAGRGPTCRESPDSAGPRNAPELCPPQPIWSPGQVSFPGMVLTQDSSSRK